MHTHECYVRKPQRNPLCNNDNVSGQEAGHKHGMVRKRRVENAGILKTTKKRRGGSGAKSKGSRSENTGNSDGGVE